MAELLDLIAGLDERVAILRDVQISLDPERVYRAQGVTSGRVSPAVRAVTGAMLPEARRLLEPTICCRVLRVQQVGHDSVTLAEGLFFQGRLPAVLFRGCSHLFAAVCTVGSALDRRIAELSEAGEIVEAFVLDAAGSAAARELKTVVQALATRWAMAHGATAGRTAGPNNSSWQLADQRVFERCLPLAGIGVEVTDELLFKPAKTVSLAVGIGDKPEEDARDGEDAGDGEDSQGGKDSEGDDCLIQATWQLC
ncbi:MAG: hypothetical protein IT307_16650 [Chloroflexi bacterium]|nr:hypothetical protein [Chloroflexota bacterium]